MLTATIIALLSISLAMFLYNQAPAVVDRLPKKIWNVGLPPGTTASIGVGTNVTLLASPDSSGAAESIGTGTVVNATSTTLRLEGVQIKPGKDGSLIAALLPAAAAPGTASTLVTAPQGEPPVQAQLVGGALIAVVLLVGALVGYWLAGVRVKTVEWLIACDFEMKRVHWTTPREVMGNTIVVIGACVLLALVIFLADTGLSSLFGAIKLLG
jgi:preprotein translocase SecE subunit